MYQCIKFEQRGEVYQPPLQVAPNVLCHHEIHLESRYIYIHRRLNAVVSKKEKTKTKTKTKTKIRSTESDFENQSDREQRGK